jgi:hypothetical protein
VERNNEPGVEDGSHPVEERPPEAPKASRSVGQTMVIVIGALVLLAALLWLVVPFGG